MTPPNDTNMKFGTVGSPKSTPKNPGGSVGAIIHMRSLGLEALELGWVQSVNVSQETCALIKSTSFSNSISLSVHAPYFINLNAREDEWPKSRKRLWDAAFYGYLAGASDIVFHPGSYFSEEPKVVLDKIIPRLNSIIEELKAANINITLRPETMGKSAMLGSLEDTLMMSKEIENIFPCLDFAHLHARPGDGSCNTLNEWLGVLDQYSAILGEQSLQNLHIHLSGIEYGAKGEKKHLPIQNSDLNVRSLFDALKLRKCDGRILCESPVFEEDAIYLQELWNKN
jgi:deoxyribonuclease-4